MTELSRRFYPLLVWSLGALLSASALVLLILMLISVIGPFRFRDSEPRRVEARLAMWIPRPGEGGEMPAGERARRIAAWRSLLPEDPPALTLHSLSELAGGRVGAVVLPDARTLDGPQLEALSSFLQAGGGVLLTGSIGVRRQDGSWLGYQSMEKLLRVPAVVPLAREQSAEILAWHRGPLSAGLAPGQHITLKPEAGVPSISNSQAELSWSQWSSQRDAAASKRMQVGGGRLAWLAFGPENALEVELEEYRAVVRVFHSALAWAQRRPAIEVLPWPGAAPFAGGIESDPDAPPSRRKATPSQLALDFEQVLARSQVTGEVARLRIPAGALDDSQESELRRWARHILQERGAWIADSGQVAAWLRARGAIAAGFTQVGPRRLLVKVTNRAPLPASGVALRVHLNRPTEKTVLGKTALLQQSPELRQAGDRETVDLLLPELPAQVSRSYTLDY